MTTEDNPPVSDDAEARLARMNANLAKVDDLSGGMKRRLTIARGLMNNPQIFMLDEPTTGLPFDDITKLLEVLQRLVDLGYTVVLIEHNLDLSRIHISEPTSQY